MTVLSRRQARCIAGVSVLLAAVVSLLVAAVGISVEWLFVAPFVATLATALGAWHARRETSDGAVAAPLAGDDEASPWPRSFAEEKRRIHAGETARAKLDAMEQQRRLALERVEELQVNLSSRLADLMRERNDLQERRARLPRRPPGGWRERYGARGLLERTGLRERRRELERDIGKLALKIANVEARLDQVQRYLAVEQAWVPSAPDPTWTLDVPAAERSAIREPEEE